MYSSVKREEILPRASRTSVRPTAPLGEIIMKPPPPRPEAIGSTTPRASDTATAASTAFPPSASTSRPASAASGCAATTMPFSERATFIRPTAYHRCGTPRNEFGGCLRPECEYNPCGPSAVRRERGGYGYHLRSDFVPPAERGAAHRASPQRGRPPRAPGGRRRP